MLEDSMQRRFKTPKMVNFSYSQSQVEQLTCLEQIWNPEIHVNAGPTRTKRRAQSAAQRKEKQQWAFEKLKLDNARKLRGICCIDLDDKEFQETKTNAMKKLELPMEAAMPCKLKTFGHREICIIEAHEEAFGKDAAERSRRSHC